MNWNERYKTGGIGRIPDPLPGESNDRNEHLNFDVPYHKEIEYKRKNTPCVDCGKTDVQLYCSFPDYDQTSRETGEHFEGCPGEKGFRKGDKLPNGYTRAMNRLVPFTAEQKCPACKRDEGMCMECLSEAPWENVEKNRNRQNEQQDFWRQMGQDGPPKSE